MSAVNVNPRRRNESQSWRLASAVIMEGKTGSVWWSIESSFVLEGLKLTSRCLPQLTTDQYQNFTVMYFLLLALFFYQLFCYLFCVFIRFYAGFSFSPYFFSFSIHIIFSSFSPSFFLPVFLFFPSFSFLFLLVLILSFVIYFVILFLVFFVFFCFF